MVNIGSEVYRVVNWRNKDNKELLRMREIWVDYFKYDNEYNSTEEGINKYFLYMAIASKNLDIS